MSTSYAEAVREGTAAAAGLHARLNTQSRASADTPGTVDVLACALELDVTVLFRPLKGLLGAYLPVPAPGILVTTQRPLSIQRFTTAHEIGHFIMRHAPSVDDEGVLRRGMLNVPEPTGDFQEVEANAFAAAFLMPKWLVVQHCARHGWTGANLRKPQMVYQLALRLGASFEATCWTLSRNQFLTRDEASAIAAVSPRTLKVELLGDVKPADYRGDVWLLTERDEGTVVTGGPNDLFVVRLQEHANGGYLWDFGELERSGFVRLRDGSSFDDTDGIGSPGLRELIAHAPAVDPVGQTLHKCRMFERRPWQPAEPLTTLELNFDLSGPESQGFSRAERRRLLEAA